VFIFQLLDLSEVLQVDNSTLAVIAANLKLLTSLTLSGCTLVTNKGVEQVLDNCPLLQSLILSGCFRVTWSSVQSLLVSTSIRIVALSGTGVTRDEVAIIREKMPTVEVQFRQNR
jgi:hypothetical protein